AHRLALGAGDVQLADVCTAELDLQRPGMGSSEGDIGIERGVEPLSLCLNGNAVVLRRQFQPQVAQLETLITRAAQCCVTAKLWILGCALACETELKRAAERRRLPDL